MFFKAKDWVTAGNAVCGLASIVCAIERLPYWASVLICVGWLFDTMDGVVARLTKTYNQFGGEFDNLCDHLTYGLAPGFVIYCVYREWFQVQLELPLFTAQLLASAAGFVLPLTGTIRGARLAVKPIKVPGFWIGLPRPVTAFIMVSGLNASFFGLWPTLTGSLLLGLIVVMGAMNLGGVPFLSHHGHVWPRYVNWILVIVVVTIALTALLGPLAHLVYRPLIPQETFFDVFFFWLFGYLLFQWHGVPAADWQRAREAVAVWRALPEP